MNADMRAAGACLWLLLVLSVAGCDRSATPTTGARASNAASNKPAVCADFAPDPFVVRNELAAGERRPNAKLLLRFWHYTDDHIIDDDGQAINGLSALDAVHPILESAMRLQEEYSDEVLNDEIQRTNACHARHPAEFMIVTGDSADLTTVAEIRRFIDNLDGTYDQMSAFETACREGLLAGASEELAQLTCTRFTGRGVADTQSSDLDVDSLLAQSVYTRTVLQLLNAESAAATGRAADGSTDPLRQTATRAPGLPQELRCTAGEPGCANTRIAMPWYVAFGNHDGYPRGTVTYEPGLNEVSLLTGRHYMRRQREFIDEFFFTQRTPGPVGHGFQHVERERREDADDRNDGYYAFDAGEGRFRMVVLNSIMDGFDPRIPADLLRNPFALADGTLDRTQFDWLKRQLAAAAARRQLVMVFSHHPDLTFAERGAFAALLPIEVTATELDAELASWPNVVAWVAGHTHRHRIRAFKVENGRGTNGEIEAAVDCRGPGPCAGFWQIETASLIDHPQEQRLIEVFDNGDGTGTLRAPVIRHRYEKSQVLAARDDQCQLYLTDPAAVAAALTDADLDALCRQGGTRQGEPGDRNVELIFRMPAP